MDDLYHMTEFKCLKAVFLMKARAVNSLLSYYTENDVSLLHESQRKML